MPGRKNKKQKTVRLQIQRMGYSEVREMGCYKQVKTKIVTNKWVQSGIPFYTDWLPGKV